MWGWVALGIGGGGLVMGGVSGAVALSLDSKLIDACGDDHACDPGQASAVKSDISAHDLTRTLTTVGLIVGVVGAGTGLTLLLTAPSQDEKRSPKAGITPFIGPASMGVKGVF